LRVIWNIHKELISQIELLKLEQRSDFVVITHREAERILAGVSSSEPRILNIEAERHVEAAVQC